MKEQDFFKYFTPSTEDKEWGLYLNVTGSARILPGKEYPPNGHPTGYNFNWEKGRILNEYQINYITEGSGIIETPKGKFVINPGTILLLYPGVLHRYKPNPATGWTEHYIGFNGDIANKLLSNVFFDLHRPVIKVGHQDKILESFYKIWDEVKSEKAGFQQVCSGLLVNILGNIISTIKNKDFEGKEIENKILHARVKMRENFDNGINPIDIAKELNISYSYFRKVFKKYTGISPSQYILLLKIQKARDFLTNSKMSIKEIAYHCGFTSIYYFSRLFKEKHGYTPSQIREMNLLEKTEIDAKYPLAENPGNFEFFIIQWIIMILTPLAA